MDLDEENCCCDCNSSDNIDRLIKFIYTHFGWKVKNVDRKFNKNLFFLENRKSQDFFFIPPQFPFLVMSYFRLDIDLPIGCAVRFCDTIFRVSIV